MTCLSASCPSNVHRCANLTSGAYHESLDRIQYCASYYHIMDGLTYKSACF